MHKPQDTNPALACPARGVRGSRENEVLVTKLCCYAGHVLAAAVLQQERVVSPLAPRFARATA